MLKHEKVLYGDILDKQKYECFDKFANDLLENGVEHIVLRVVREIRPQYEGPVKVTIGPVHFGEFLGYLKGKVFQCFVEGPELDRCEAWADAHSISVKKVSGNIT